MGATQLPMGRIMLSRISFMLFVLVCSAAAVAQSRGETNLKLLLDRQIHFSQLSPIEREEVLELMERLRIEQPQSESQAESCWRRELEKNSEPSDLAIQLIELRCGKGGNDRMPRDEE
jgi:hypothetical protein